MSLKDIFEHHIVRYLCKKIRTLVSIEISYMSCRKFSRRFVFSFLYNLFVGSRKKTDSDIFLSFDIYLINVFVTIKRLEKIKKLLQFII